MPLAPKATPTPEPRAGRLLAGRASGPLLDFLASVGPKAERLLASYRLEDAQAEEILLETLQVLVWKWETVRNREAWLLAVLEGRCRARSRVMPGGTSLPKEHEPGRPDR